MVAVVYRRAVVQTGFGGLGGRHGTAGIFPSTVPGSTALRCRALRSQRGSTRTSMLSCSGCVHSSTTRCLGSIPRARRWTVCYETWRLCRIRELRDQERLAAIRVTRSHNYSLGPTFPPIPDDNSVKIDGVTHTAGGRPIRSNVIYPGSLLLVRVPDDTQVQGTPVSFFGDNGHGYQCPHVAGSACNFGVVRAWHGPSGELQRWEE